MGLEGTEGIVGGDDRSGILSKLDELDAGAEVEVKIKAAAEVEGTGVEEAGTLGGGNSASEDEIGITRG